MPLVPNPQSEPVTFPNWGDFKLAMHTNEAYQRCSTSSANRLTVNRLESLFTSQIENWEVAAQLWNHMLEGCPSEVLPTAEEAAAWTQIASTNNMPIQFTETGQLTPL